MEQREEKILSIIKEFSDKLPKFPDGRIDYSDSDIAPVVTVFIKYKDEILILKRSNKVRAYKGKWNTVAGYLDELKFIKDKSLQEIQEELGVGEDDILSFHIGEIYRFKDIKINKSWIVVPVLVELKIKPNIVIDWEHTEYRWIMPEKLKDLDIVSNLDKSLENAFK